MSSFIDEVVELEREDKTVDIVKRLGVLTADRVHLTNHAADNPVTMFNPTILVKNEHLKIYARIVLGYFTYTSAVVELTLPIAELNDISKGRYSGRIVIQPDNKYDIWGTEDPRACKVKGKNVITYCGRTVNYFRPGTERVLPIVAVFDGNRRLRYQQPFRPSPAAESDRLHQCRESLPINDNHFLPYQRTSDPTGC